MASKQEFLKRVEERLKYVPRPLHKLAEDQDPLKQMDIMIMNILRRVQSPNALNILALNFTHPSAEPCNGQSLPINGPQPIKN